VGSGEDPQEDTNITASAAVSNFSFTDKPTRLAQGKFPSIVSGFLVGLDEVRVAAFVARARTRLGEV